MDPNYYKPTNQHQQVLWYLINWKYKFSLANVINHNMFYKFQTRLSDIELKHGNITEKERVKFVNVFKVNSSFTCYKCVDVDKAKKLFKLYKSKRNKTQ